MCGIGEMPIADYKGLQSSGNAAPCTVDLLIYPAGYCTRPQAVDGQCVLVCYFSLYAHLSKLRTFLHVHL